MSFRFTDWLLKKHIPRPLVAAYFSREVNGKHVRIVSVSASLSRCLSAACVRR